MGEVGKATHDVGGRGPGREKRPARGEVPPRRIVVGKRTHRARLEKETQSEVTVVIEEKVGEG